MPETRMRKAEAMIRGTFNVAGGYMTTVAYSFYEHASSVGRTVAVTFGGNTNVNGTKISFDSIGYAGTNKSLYVSDITISNATLKLAEHSAVINGAKVAADGLSFYNHSVLFPATAYLNVNPGYASSVEGLVVSFGVTAALFVAGNSGYLINKLTGALRDKS